MHMNSTALRGVLGCAHCMAAAAVLLGASGVAAQSSDTAAHHSTSQFASPGPAFGQGLGLRLGYHPDYRRATLAYETGSLWSHAFNNEWGRVGMSVEFGASYWKADHGGPDSMGQLSAIPMLRWWPNETFYLEGGVGPTVLSRTRFAGEELSTGLQFASQFGAGIFVANTHQLGIRYSHYSNAGIKKPNPGLELFEVTYTFRY